MSQLPPAIPFAAAVLASAPAASDLTVDGASSTVTTIGSPVAVELSGGAGLRALVLVDLDPGPTTVLGEEVPLGFTPALAVVSQGVTDGNGTFSLSLTTPGGPGAVGTTFFLAGALLDAADPNGVDFSSGADVTLLSPLDVIAAELAGNSLPGPPHFEFVRAFNGGSSVEVAVDPLLHPTVAGATADLWVAPARTAAEWTADPVLVDATADGPETVTFHPGDFAANRFTVDAGSLPSVSGADIGIGYDVVVDLDRDGLLGEGDLIDGFGHEAGLWAVRDTNQPGPYAVVESIYSLGTWLGQDLYYPANVAELGELPLVVVSHGNGHDYRWYDHLGEHLASYGFVVMSHQNNTVPGIEAASETTLDNTDVFLGNLDVIESGLLEGHVDGGSLFWIGHSRGGEGVARAYDRLVDGDYVPQNYSAGDVVLVSSIAPTDFLGTASSTPHDKPYHLWVGSADNDVSGCASNPIAQSFPLHDRAEDQRLAISLHGVGHGDFHDGGGSSVAAGPCLLGRARTHRIMRGYVLPLFRHHLTGEPAAKDFLWRQWESFQPTGAPNSECSVVQLQFREGAAAGKLVLDDFQTQPDEGVASSGAAVVHDLDDLVEGRLDDANSSFTDDAGDAFNGFTYGRSTDSSRGVVFSYGGGDRSLAYELSGSLRDWSGHGWLSFRAAQAPRHPLTIAVEGDQVLSVRLTSGGGATSTLSIGAWGGGLEEPYQRSGCGIGFGWASEMETIRIRLGDFLLGGTGVDLADVERLEFLFGPSHGQGEGRIGMDDIELVAE